MVRMSLIWAGLAVVFVSSCGKLTTPLGGDTDPADPYAWTGDSKRPVARPTEITASQQNVGEVQPGYLGVTVVSLGSPAEAGLWLKTPLVPAQSRGRLVHGGKSVEVQLIPIEGASGAGSRISLQAMQALGIPLTELAEVAVSAL